MSANTVLIDESAISAAIAGFAAGIVPGAAALDTPVIAGIWTNMIVKIAVNDGRADVSKELALSAAKGFISYIVGSRIIGSIFSFIPGVNFLVAGVNAAMNYYYTRELGKATERFLANGIKPTELARLAWDAIPKPSTHELLHIWSVIKVRI